MSAQPYSKDWSSIDSRAIPSWFEDAKFGIFIHWGLYSVPSYSPARRDSVSVYDRYAEHYWRRLIQPSSTQHYFTEFHNKTYGADFRYEDFASDFTAEMFQPEEWAKVFESSGARYVVLTSKHHEGFCLWPSKYSWNWNAVDLGPHRDLLGDLTKAVRDKGLKMGYYYSLLEWFNPLYKKETLTEYIDQHMLPQMKELVESYHPDIFWTDGEWDYSSEELRSTEFLSWLFSDSSVKENVVVNDRWGKETRGKHGSFFTTEYGLVGNDSAEDMEFHHPWEENRGIGGSFGFNRNEYLDEYASSEELIHLLINKVARGGNLLLNIGPTADGRIPLLMQERLKDIGDWLSINGDAIYGSRKWEGAPVITKDTEVFFTKKEHALYVIMTRYQAKPITINGVSGVKKVSMLGYNGNVSYRSSGDKLIIQPVQLKSPDDLQSTHAWVFKVELR